jgi:hypothetical protein
MAGGSRQRTRSVIALTAVVATLFPATAQSRPHQGSSAALRAEVTAERTRDYEAGTGSVVGLVLILTASGAAAALHQARKNRRPAIREARTARSDSLS